ncbi:eukaryotic translation initiation factor [Cystoisospora suis]|uniref:Translation initiation factor eIF2B subunit beta n=1 Tax=Cystoisospora suis TaxID=483139 RepID=A0A2C6L672_9APIC|nr:eukaryotic translation initiation factor [Cystoisospora suis]
MSNSFSLSSVWPSPDTVQQQAARDGVTFRTVYGMDLRGNLSHKTTCGKMLESGDLGCTYTSRRDGSRPQDLRALLFSGESHARTSREKDFRESLSCRSADAREKLGPPPLLSYVPPPECFCCSLTFSKEGEKKTPSDNDSVKRGPPESGSKEDAKTDTPGVSGRDAVSAGSATPANNSKEWSAPFIDALILQLRRRELHGSHQAARRTAEVLRRVVDIYPWTTTQGLIEVVKQVGRRLIRANPMEFLVANVVRRVLCIIRMEHYKHVDLHRHQQNQHAPDRPLLASSSLPLPDKSSPVVKCRKCLSSESKKRKDNTEEGPEGELAAPRGRSNSSVCGDRTATSSSLPHDDRKELGKSGRSCCECGCPRRVKSPDSGKESTTTEGGSSKEDGSRRTSTPTKTASYDRRCITPPLSSLQSSGSGRGGRGTAGSSPLHMNSKRGGGNWASSTQQDYRQLNSKWTLQRAAPSMAMYFDPYAAADADDLLLPIPSTVKQSIFEGISELVAEVDSAWEEGDDVRTACFLNGDCILTYGYSLAVERLLKAIHRRNQGEGESGTSRRKKGRIRCSFQVIVLGGDAEQGGKKMAENLVASGIKTAYVADGALFAVMHKVDKVLLGTTAVLSSGGAVTVSGARYVADAAKAFSKPVLVVAPLFKLTHLPVYDHHSRNELLPPGLMLHDSGVDMEDVSIRIPLYDYIPDHLLTVFITEIGPIDPSYLFTLSTQRYHIDDLDLCAVD